MKKSINLLLVLTLLLTGSFAVAAEEGGQYGREKERREVLRKRWFSKKISNQEYYNMLYAPTKMGAASTIKKLKRSIAGYKSKLKTVKSKSVRTKYIRTIKVYGEHIQVLEGVLERLKKEDYYKLCTEDFVNLLKSEKKVARYAGSRIPRDWPLTIELYPNLYTDAASEDNSSEEGNEETGEETDSNNNSKSQK